MTISATQKPPPHPFYGDTWKRALDPWHRDAFPDDMKLSAPRQEGKRSEGWMLEDAFGNAIQFIGDGVTK